MNKAVLALVLAISFTCALAKYRGYWGYGGSNGFGGYGGYGNYGGGGGYNGGYGGGYGGSASYSAGGLNKQACSYVVENANGALEQVIIDVRNQVNDWILYSDLDAIDEIGYYLENACNTKNFAVVSKGKNDPACKSLGKLLQSILDQEEIEAFRGRYQEALQLGEKALKIGKALGNECKIKLVQKQPQANQKSDTDQEKTGRGIGKQHEDLAKSLNEKYENKYKNQQKQDEKPTESQDNDQEKINNKGREIGQKHEDLAKSLNKKYEDKYKNQQNQHNQESKKDEEAAHSQKIKAAKQEESDVEEESDWFSNEESINEEEYNIWSEEGYSFGEENELNEESNWFSEEETTGWNEEEYEIGEAGESNEEELSWFPGGFGHGWHDWDKDFNNEEHNNEESHWHSEEETAGWNEEEYALGEENELNEEFNNEEGVNEEDILTVTIIDESDGYEDKYTVSIVPNDGIIINHTVEELNLEEGEAEEGSIDDDLIVIIQERSIGNKPRLGHNAEESDISDLNMDDFVNFMSKVSTTPMTPRKASWTFQERNNQVNEFFDLVWE